MPINLTKGQKVDLTKGNPGLKNIMIGLGWDVNAFDSGANFDLDASVFMVGENGNALQIRSLSSTETSSTSQALLNIWATTLQVRVTVMTNR